MSYDPPQELEFRAVDAVQSPGLSQLIAGVKHFPISLHPPDLACSRGRSVVTLFGETTPMQHEEKLSTNGPLAETTQRAKELREGISDVADALYHRAESTFEEMKRGGERSLERLYDEGRKQVRTAGRKIQDDPIRSVLLAAGVGVLAGLILQRWRRGTR